MTFVKSNWITLGSAIDIWMINHPLGTLASFGIKNKPRIVLMQDTKYVLRLSWPRHRRADLAQTVGCAKVS